jgi:two-component system sensor histidine kinase BarA
MREKGVRISMSSSLSVPIHLVSDWERYKMILLNIIQNSVKYTYKGAIEIHLNLKKDQPDLSGKLITTLVTTIKDTGIGISN